jgi:hypothetical protein
MARAIAVLAYTFLFSQHELPLFSDDEREDILLLVTTLVNGKAVPETTPEILPSVALVDG